MRILRRVRSKTKKAPSIVPGFQHFFTHLGIIVTFVYSAVRLVHVNTTSRLHIKKHRLAEKWEPRAWVRLEPSCQNIIDQYQNDRSIRPSGLISNRMHCEQYTFRRGCMLHIRPNYGCASLVWTRAVGVAVFKIISAKKSLRRVDSMRSPKCLPVLLASNNDIVHGSRIRQALNQDS